jgi:surface protein
MPGTFNQDISSWNTGSALTMDGMFYNQKAFNQNIGGWDVSKVTNFTGMFNALIKHLCHIVS